MKVEHKQLHNIWGYPMLSPELVAEAKKARVEIILGVERIFESSFKPKSKVLVVDQFGKLRACGVPILGYRERVDLSWDRTEREPLKSLMPNSVEISHPFYISNKQTSARTSVPLFLELHASKDLKSLAKKYKKEIQDPKQSRHKWLRAVVNNALNPKVVVKKGSKKALMESSE